MRLAARQLLEALPGCCRLPLRWLAGLIGLSVLSPQLARGQEGSPVVIDGPGWITIADDKVRDRFRQLLLAVPSRDLTAGWQLALDLGRPAVPLLWDMLKAERSDVGQRLRLLVAAMLAGGPLEDERLFAWLGLQRPMLEERTLAAMLLACGPLRARPVGAFWPRLLGGTKEPELILAIAARLAAVRFPGAADEAAPVLVEDAGVLAASAFCGQALPGPMAARWWNLRDPPRHADLVWRGAFLGAARSARGGGQVPGGYLERASDVMRLGGEAFEPAQRAAVWLRVRGGDLRADGSRLEVPLLQIATGDLATARALQAWLPPAPQPRDEAPARLAVAYALAHHPDAVIAERDKWLPDTRIRSHIAMALAWALAGGTAPSPVEVRVPEFAEWDLVRAASGAPADGEGQSEEPRVQALVNLARKGRLPRAAMRTQIEEALWRSGGHPRRAPFELERALLRDLLLAGSNPGVKYHAHLRQGLRYSPGGMDRNDAFFAIAVAAFDFLDQPRSPMPPEHRLPD